MESQQTHHADADNTGLPSGANASAPNTSTDSPPGPVALGPLPTVPTPPVSPQKSSKLMLIIILAVVVLVAGAVLLLMGSKSSKEQNNTSDKNGSSQSAKSEAAASSKTYTSKSGSFSFTKPTGWKATEDGTVSALQGAEGVMYMPQQSDPADISTILIYAIELPAGTSLTGTIDEGKKTFESFPGYQLLEYKTFKRDGNEAAYVEVKYSLGDALIHQSQLAISKGSKLYAVTSTLPEDKWIAQQSVIKTLNDSFKVK